MSWWNLGGLNPKYEDFLEKHRGKKTMIGMAWSLYWRFGLFILALELILGAVFAVLIFLLT